MDISHIIFKSNREWAARVLEIDPGFFENLSKEQKPEYLWIGCSDSRVPANQISGLPPGELFVHRNIANLVVPTDMNCLSVIQYAVEVIGVKHIIVCGHYGCGGIKSAMENRNLGLIDNWLNHIKGIYRHHKDEIDSLKEEQKRSDLLCELNVLEQVRNVSNTSVVKSAWEAGRELTIHGWIYNIRDGLLKDLNVRTSGARN